MELTQEQARNALGCITKVQADYGLKCTKMADGRTFFQWCGAKFTFYDVWFRTCKDCTIVSCGKADEKTHDDYDGSLCLTMSAFACRNFHVTSKQIKKLRSESKILSDFIETNGLKDKLQVSCLEDGTLVIENNDPESLLEIVFGGSNSGAMISIITPIKKK